MSTVTPIPGVPSMKAEQRRGVFRDVSTVIQIVAADTSISDVIASRANYNTWIQRIVVWINTDAAQSMIFQDGTPKIVAVIASSPGANTRWDFDFGPIGTPITAGDGLDIILSGAGLAANVEIYGYQALANAIASNAAVQ